MKAMNTQTMIIIAAIAVLVIGTIVYYAVAQRRSSFEDADIDDVDMDTSDDEDVSMVSEDDSDPETDDE